MIPSDSIIGKPEAFLEIEEQAKKSKGRFHATLIGLQDFCGMNPDTPHAKELLKRLTKEYEKAHGKFDGIPTKSEEEALRSIDESLSPSL